MKEDSVRSVERAFSILKAFTRDDYKLSLSELANRIGLPITTTLRLAGTLENMNMLHRHSDRCYSLGNQLYLLGSIAKVNFRPQQIIYPYMKQVREETKEAVSLYGVVEDYRVCFKHVDSLLSMRCVMRIGDRMPLWTGAGGRALLAFMGEEIIEREIAKAHPITQTTLCDPVLFREEILKIRSLGYAVSYGDREEGIFSVAVPIFNRRGDIEYSFSVAGPSLRFTEEEGHAIVPKIQKMCREIATQI